MSKTVGSWKGQAHIAKEETSNQSHSWQQLYRVKMATKLGK